MRDAVAVLDHLKIDKAHLIGLSMGGYTALQVALNHPERVRSMVLAGTGSGSRALVHGGLPQALARPRRPVRARRFGRVAKTYGRSPSRIPFVLKDPRGFAEFKRS